MTPHLLALQFLALWLVVPSLGACERSDRAPETKHSTPTPTASQPASPSPGPVFEPIAPGRVVFRGAPRGSEGRFPSRPGIVATPCGFHLVTSTNEGSWIALLVGHELAWTPPSEEPLLRVDGVIVDAGLVTATAMGGDPSDTGDTLLHEHGQWESAWLKAENRDRNVPVRENAKGAAHFAPHPTWRAWSTTLLPGSSTAGALTSHVVVASVALGHEVLALRALLTDEAQASRALRRLVFAVDSIEPRPGQLHRTEYIQALERAALDDPTCQAVHSVYDQNLD